jgi:DNA repair exonuclease SbcCD ATPase subunit
VRALEADDLAAVIAEYFQRLSKERERSVAAPGTLKRRMTEINKKTAKLADLLTKTTAQAALLRQIESLEKERDGVGVKLASMESERAAMKVCADITPDTVRRLLRTILNDLNDNPDRLRDAIHQLIDRVELSPGNFEAVPKYRISPLVKSGELVASPRGFEPRYLP